MREVADQLGQRKVKLSHMSIAKYENGQLTPTESVLAVLAKMYGKPVEWFLDSGTPIAHCAFRNLKSRVSEADKRQYIATAQKWLEAYKKLETKVGNCLRKPTVTTETDPLYLAQEVRQRLQLGDHPVPSVIAILEFFGIRTIEVPTSLSIDGMACKFGDEYAVVLNPLTSNDRARMNAGHELGHVLLGDCEDGVKFIDDDAEARAYEFASHLLMPQKQLREVFKNRSMVGLVKAKEQYGLSMQAMIYRASNGPEKLLDQRTSKWLWIQFAKRGWRRQEPGYVRPDRATRFERLLETAISSRSLRWPEAEMLLGIHRSELTERIDLAVHGPESEEGGDSAVIQFGQ